MRERARFHGRQKRDSNREVEIDRDTAMVYASLVSPGPSPRRAAISAEEIAPIERGFAKLSDDYREVITLTKIAGVPYKEVAEQLGRSGASMRMLLGRALVKFAEELEKA